MYRFELDYDEKALLVEGIIRAMAHIESEISNLEVLKPQKPELNQSRLDLIEKHKRKLVDLDGLKIKLYATERD